MSFKNPPVLIALLAIPLLAWWYVGHQRRRVKAAAAFVAPALTPSVAPRSPRWRRHAPMIAFGLALAVLVVAAARPQRTVAVPLTDGAVMLANDVSSSMRATDVSPSREGAAKRAAERFLADVPDSVQVGLLAFARTPIVLQSPTTNHSLTRAALNRLPATSGGTAIGQALLAAAHQLRALPRVGGKRPPGAIVLISDGASNVGIGALVAARQVAAEHIPVYTVAVGTAHGTIPGRRGSRAVRVPVPVSTGQLAQIARVARGRAFTATDSGTLRTVYAHLAARLGHKHVKQEITASFAGGGLVLLLLGSAMSLRWFGRLV